MQTTYFRRNHRLIVKQKNKEKSGTQIGVNAVNATYMESLFCQDTNEVPEELFEGQKCITKSSWF